MKISELLVCCCMGALMLFPSTSFGNQKPKGDIKDGALVISGDLTYDKVKEALAPLMGKKQKDGVTNSKTIKIDKAFHAVDADFVTIVNFTQSNEPSCSVEVPALVKTMVDVYYKDGCLSVKRNGNKRTANNINEYVVVKISAPKLTSLKLATASKATIESLIQKNDVSVEVSAASTVAFGRVECPKLDIKSSGASEATFENIKTESVVADVNGASKVSLNGNMGNMMLEISGCSTLKAKGKAANADMKVSGVSTVNILNLSCQNIKKNVDSTSKIKEQSTLIR